ncbi:MAG TPA: serine hydrolase domain-containing protein, partial [Gemmatimonadaceae bacterium]|nr:serine hydrolase domain-containing protein [Gemmatimonadaceae bacterium]
MTILVTMRSAVHDHALVFLLAFAVACAGAHAPIASSQGPAPSSERAILRDSLRAILSRAQRDSAFPGAYAVVGTHTGILAEYGVGHLDWGPSAVPDEHSLWDLASLTKVVGMTTAIMQLYEQGKVELDAPLQRYIPEWQGPHKELVTIRH